MLYESKAQLFTQIGIYRNDASTIYATIGCQVPIKSFSMETYISLPFWRGDDLYRYDNTVHLSGSGLFIGTSIYYHIKRFDIGITAQARRDVYTMPKVVAPYTYEFYKTTYPAYLIVNYNVYKEAIKIGSDISWNQVGIHMKLLIWVKNKRVICDL